MDNIFSLDLTPINFRRKATTVDQTQVASVTMLTPERYLKGHPSLYFTCLFQFFNNATYK